MARARSSERSGPAGPSGTTGAVVALLCLAALTHFAALSYPRQVVFDEAMMGKYVAGYCCTGERVFDLHPPNAKLLIGASARLAGFDGRFPFGTIGLPYGDTPIFALRLVPALAGTLIPALFFLLLREWRASYPVAFLGGLLLALDNALLLETRIIVWDGILVASTIATLWCFFRGAGHDRLEWKWLAGAGAFAGLAVGTKFTGLSAVAVMGLCLLSGVGITRARLAARVRAGALIAVAGIAVYVAGWVGHALLLTQPGPADAFYTSDGVVDEIVAAHRSMWRENVNLSATHPDASAAWTWPLMRVAPYFWQGDGASIYLAGNPVVWWGTALLLVAIAGHVVLQRASGRTPAPANPEPRVGLALGAYLIAYVPLFFVSRVLFLYHYLTPLVLSVAVVLLALDRAGWTRPAGLTRQPASYYVVIALAVAGFLAMSPLTYGYSAGGYDEWLASVVRSWR
jgi:dolichyl-phosphate-mannose--protein O-mannosyl transferase